MNAQTPAIIDHDDEDEAMEMHQSLAIGLTRAEIDQQIATARAYPRSIKRATDAIASLATLDEETAAECTYALPRGGKPITGPSIRLAEIIMQSWGNNRVAARVVHVDRAEKYVEAEGIYHDLETNVATAARVRRRIVDKYGKLYTDDMIIVTGNAACAIAKRNAILGGVPRPVWRRAEAETRQIVAGDITTLATRRDKAIAAFANYGVTPEQVFAALGVAGVEDIKIDHIPTLRGMFSALKNGEATVEEMFARRVAGPAHEVIANPLSDKKPDPPHDPATGEIKPTTESPAAPLPSPAGDAKGAGTEGKSEPAPGASQEAAGGHDAISAAWVAGQSAKAAGVPRKSPPGEYREKGREAELSAWWDGYDGKAAQAAGA